MSALLASAPVLAAEKGESVERPAGARGGGVSLAPMVGCGTNGLGFGLGVRAGYTFGLPVYLGGNLVYHSGSESQRTDFYFPSAEVGLDLKATSILFRPYVGVGALFKGRDLNSSTLHWSPGVTLEWLVLGPFFIGADARVLVPFDGTRAFAAYVLAGFNL
jgi:hypothetical protein